MSVTSNRHSTNSRFNFPRQQEQIDGCDAFLVIYSVVDKASFTRAEYFLSLLQDMDLLRSRCCILVGNKIDLARSRAISSQGECFSVSLFLFSTRLLGRCSFGNVHNWNSFSKKLNDFHCKLLWELFGQSWQEEGGKEWEDWSIQTQQQKLLL